jgi:hypothetical protein
MRYTFGMVPLLEDDDDDDDDDDARGRMRDLDL